MLERVAPIVAPPRGFMESLRGKDVRELLGERGHRQPLQAPFGGRFAFRRGAGGGVPTDGPNNWYVPQSDEHFSALALNTPDHLLLCHDTASPLVPTIDGLSAGNWAAGAGGALYEQSITDWARKWVGFDGTAVNQRFSNSSSAFDVALGESFAMLCLVSFTAPPATGNLFTVQGGGNRVLPNTNGTLQTRHGNVTATSSGSHSGLSTVHWVGWYRRGDSNASGMETDLESVSGTHDEDSQTGTTHCLGANTTTSQQVEARYGWVAIWKGANAEFSMASMISTLKNGS